MNVDDSNEVRSTEIREKLTLHVKRRISGGTYDIKVEKNMEVNCGEDEPFSSSSRKKSGKGKKKKSPKPSKKAKIKVEDTGTDDLSEDRCNLYEAAGAAAVTSVEGDEFTSTGTEDTTPPGTATPQKDSPEPSLQLKNPNDSNIGRDESFLNNSILTEILNERKRALFESKEVLEYLGKKIKNS